MQFYSRRLVKYQDLSPAGRLIGGRLLEWIDEEAAIYAACKLNNKPMVTKFMSEINFVAPAKLGDVIEFGLELIAVGTSSITISCVVFKKENRRPIVAVDEIVFVCIDENGSPQNHGLTFD